MGIRPIKLKGLILFVLATFAFGGLGALLGGDTSAVYNTLIKPPLSPPGIIFPIVWGILYALMGVGAYILSNERVCEVSSLLKIYWLQLLLNALWPLFFWRFEMFSFAAFIIAGLIILNLIFFVGAFKVNKLSAVLFIPYIIWLCFALYLNIGIAVLN